MGKVGIVQVATVEDSGREEKGESDPEVPGAKVELTKYC